MNEHNSIVLRAKADYRSGSDCWKDSPQNRVRVHEGDVVQRGDRFGLIRFGSRLDVYLPPDFSFEVPIGTRSQGWGNGNSEEVLTFLVRY